VVRPDLYSSALGFLFFNYFLFLSFLSLKTVLALVISGSTLHSYLGVGLGTEPIAELIKYVNAAAQDRMRSIRSIVIDDVFSCHPVFFTKVSRLLQHFRSNTAPFGGLRVIVCGDPLKV
jgi:ATP-dependent DNA helicase PIF1